MKKIKDLVPYLAVLTAFLSMGAKAEKDSIIAPPQVADYKALSAKWWQWTVSTPFSENGPFGENGTACGENQSKGNVFFLAGQFTSNPANRICTIPADKWVFFPVINVECSSLEGAPFFGGSVAERLACVNQDDFAFSNLFATLDGKPIAERALENYLVTSPNFPFVAVEGNPAGIPAGKGFSVSKGVWLLLAPLDRGEHVIEFRGTFEKFGFTPSATYHVTIE